MPAIEALTFDLNDTLVDTSGVQEAVVHTCHDLAAAQLGLDAARLLEANHQAWGAYWPEVEEKWTLGALDGQTVSLEAWRRTLRACGRDDDQLARLATAALRRHVRETVRLFDDVADLFTWASDVCLPLALVSNGASDSQREILGNLGLGPQFAAIVLSGELGIAKPDPAIFAVAIDKLGVLPEHVWQVGDTLQTDVLGAQAAGLTAVWLNRRRLARSDDEPVPDHEIRSLAQLSGLLAGSAPACSDRWLRRGLGAKPCPQRYTGETA